MYNIIKIEGGFELNGRVYEFIEIDGLNYQIISNEQAHIRTNNGIILLDLSCTINDVFFEDIINFIDTLYG